MDHFEDIFWIRKTEFPGFKSVKFFCVLVHPMMEWSSWSREARERIHGTHMENNYATLYKGCWNIVFWRSMVGSWKMNSSILGQVGSIFRCEVAVSLTLRYVFGGPPSWHLTFGIWKPRIWGMTAMTSFGWSLSLGLDRAARISISSTYTSWSTHPWRLTFYMLGF